MALRRMFSLEVVDTDQFQDLPPTAQNLYFHLGMRADDDGFVSSPRRIISNIGSKSKDLQLLSEKGLVIPFSTGPCVIRHWRVNNYLRHDRYKETAFQEEKKSLMIDQSMVYRLATDGIPAVDHLATQDRLGKDRIGKDRVEAPPAGPDARGRYGWVRLSDEAYGRLLEELGETELRRCIDYVDESAQSTGNRNKWTDWNLVVRRCHRDGWGLRKGRAAADSAVTSVRGYDDEDEFLGGV